MRILCVSTQKNEGPFLLEWIAHLLGAGVDELLIYSNDCEDGSDEMLDLLADAGVLTHVRHSAVAGESVQWQALKAAWKHPLRKQADWALVCDVDEFPVVKVGDYSLRALIDAVPVGTDAITVPWRLFGANGVMRLQDALVTQQFTLANPPQAIWPVAATFFKTLFRLDGPFNQFGVHRPKQKAEEKAGLPNWVNGSGQAMPEGFVRNVQRLSLFGMPPARELVEMNHYSLRSAESFLVKQDRGLPNRSDKALDLTYWVERNFNEVPAPEVQAMAPRTAENLAMLRAVAGVPEAHEHALGWHRQRFSDLLLTEDGHRLFGQLLVSGSSTTPPPEAAMQMARWYQRIHQRAVDE